MLRAFWWDFMLSVLVGLHVRNVLERLYVKNVVEGLHVWSVLEGGQVRSQKIDNEVMVCVAMGSLLMSHIPAGHEVRSVPCALWTVVLRLAES